MSTNIWDYLSHAEGGIAAENPIEINKKLKAQDYADPNDVQPTVEGNANVEHPKHLQFTGSLFPTLWLTFSRCISRWRRFRRLQAGCGRRSKEILTASTRSNSDG